MYIQNKRKIRLRLEQLRRKSAGRRAGNLLKKPHNRQLLRDGVREGVRFAEAWQFGRR
jgi:hypothetical protein